MPRTDRDHLDGTARPDLLATWLIPAVLARQPRPSTAGRRRPAAGSAWGPSTIAALSLSGPLNSD